MPNPTWLFTATAVPADCPPFVVSWLGDMPTFHLSLLADCAAAGIPAIGTRVSWSKTMSAPVPRQYGAPRLQILGLNVSTAQQPLSMCWRSACPTDPSSAVMGHAGPYAVALFLLNCMCGCGVVCVGGGCLGGQASLNNKFSNLMETPGWLAEGRRSARLMTAPLSM